VSDPYSRALEAARRIQSRTRLQPGIAVVLGSGLGGFTVELDDAVVIPYEEIPHFPRSTAIGHAGRLAIGTADGIPVVCMQGRVHLYEGYTPEQVTFPVRVLGCMGIKALVLTNAAGGINPEYRRGALVLIRDHINLQGQNSLVGPNIDQFGPRFPDMTDAYSERFCQFAMQEGERIDWDLHQGVYAAVLGPSYETPAEIRFLRTIGADLVGMSTVLEAIAARQMNIEVLAISCVTNMAAGLSGEKINHDEVLEIGARVQGRFLTLLRAVLPKIAQSV